MALQLDFLALQLECLGLQLDLGPLQLGFLMALQCDFARRRQPSLPDATAHDPSLTPDGERDLDLLRATYVPNNTVQANQN